MGEKMRSIYISNTAYVPYTSKVLNSNDTAAGFIARVSDDVYHIAWHSMSCHSIVE